MARHATIIGETEDLDGFLWDVREVRPTRHGFSLFIGWPSGFRGKGCGGPRLIPTRELQDYWAARALSRDGSIFDLPAGATALKRLRRSMGFNSYAAHQQWWQEHIFDLARLSLTDFARIHGVCLSDVSRVSKEFFGPRQRHPGWFQQPQAKALLLSDLPHAWVAHKLGISIGASGRLRSMLRRQNP